MSKRLVFQGYSDDTFMCEGAGIDVDRDNCANGEPIHMLVESEEGSLIVTGHYAAAGTPNGGWMIGVATHDPTHDDVPIPGWPISFRPCARTTYTPELLIEAPDDVTVRVVEGQDATPLAARR